MKRGRAPFDENPAPDADTLRRAGVLVAHGTDAAAAPAPRARVGGRQRPVSVSQTGRDEGQQCVLSAQQVASGIGQQPQVKQKPAMSLKVGWRFGVWSVGLSVSLTATGARLRSHRLRVSIQLHDRARPRPGQELQPKANVTHLRQQQVLPAGHSCVSSHSTGSGAGGGVGAGGSGAGGGTGFGGGVGPGAGAGGVGPDFKGYDGCDAMPQRPALPRPIRILMNPLSPHPAPHEFLTTQKLRALVSSTLSPARASVSGASGASSSLPLATP
jgi:hypothetical protein